MLRRSIHDHDRVDLAFDSFELQKENKDPEMHEMGARRQPSNHDLIGVVKALRPCLMAAVRPASRAQRETGRIVGKSFGADGRIH